MKTLFAALVALASVTAVLFLWCSALPLGVPGEWTWDRAAGREPPGGLLLDWVEPLLVGALLLGGMAAGARRMRRCGRLEAGGWLLALVAGGCVWLLTVQEGSPATLRLAKVPLVLYYKGPSGYFTTARYEIADLRSFLAGYESRLAEGDVLHEGTHPPGLVVFHRSLFELCQAYPALVTGLLAVQPQSVAASFDGIEEFAAGSEYPLGRTERAAIWLAALITLFAVSASVLPLYGLLRFELEPVPAWRAVCFWPFVPGLAVFFPKSDLLYALPALLFLLASVRAWRRGSAGWAMAAGVVMGCGMIASLVFLPVAAAAALWSLWEWRTGSDAGVSLSKRLQLIGWALGGFALVTVGFGLWGRINLLHVWWLNYRNHSGFYGEYPRTYWKWLLINPLELAFAAGIPLACLAAWSLFTSDAEKTSGSRGGSRWRWSLALTWGLLWFTGKNMGEAARLWIPFLPWMICLAAPRFADSANGTAGTAGSRRWLALLGLQALVCVLTVNAVDGFQLGSLEQQQQQLRERQAADGGAFADDLDRNGGDVPGPAVRTFGLSGNAKASEPAAPAGSITTTWQLNLPTNSTGRMADRRPLPD